MREQRLGARAARRHGRHLMAMYLLPFYISLPVRMEQVSCGRDKVR